MSRSRNRGPLIWDDSANLPAKRPDDATVPLPADRWSFAEAPLALPEPPPPAPAPVGGPHGCVLAAVALLLIGVVAALAAWPLAVRPYLRGVARDSLREGIATQVAAVEDVPALPSGDLVLTEADLNAYLRANAASFAPLADPQVAITSDGLRFTFSLYGTDGAYAGRPAVRDGRLVILDGRLEGIAAQLLTPEDAAALVEEQFANLLARSQLRPTGVELRDGVITITTAPAT